MYLIRKAARDDAQAIFTLRNAAIRNESAGHYTTEIIDLWTKGETPSDQFCQWIAARFYIAELDGEVVASGTIDPTDGKIDAIFVCPRHTRKGIGKAMLAFLEKLAGDQGLEVLHLEATLNAASFYRSQGFIGHEVAQFHSPRGFAMDCVPMQKRLKQTTSN
ncbi:GNAT family N-acetyltransferase [Chitinimonas arctica]|uniref:GNAT family N-acetyltransferase n=1 Tax=Chitinimonas arctica TaxID=2594795 RepID=A0A516SK67_9NEIS|nr:GNAT family N-acetyltransferase [Chitinimonas arctica]QDQ28546.1 GNAT family N-acetyltransferase [Chitinimonas arctica]